MSRIILVLVLALAATLALPACQKRVVKRSGIGDPLYDNRPRESPDNVVGKKYDDGEFEQQR